MNKLTLLFVTLFSIGCSFFLGYFFGKNLSETEIMGLKQNLQVSLRSRGNSIDVEKSHADMRIIVDGVVLSGTGSIELKKK